MILAKKDNTCNLKSKVVLAKMKVRTKHRRSLRFNPTHWPVFTSLVDKRMVQTLKLWSIRKEIRRERLVSHLRLQEENLFIVMLIKEGTLMASVTSKTIERNTSK